MKKFILATLGSLALLSASSQSVNTSICTWKGDATGAYNFIHDDYGDTGVDGIWKYADTIAHNRGLKFTFGAITSACENNRSINGYSNPYEYAKQVMMAQHGHEIMNHSHTHDCAVGRAGWGDGGTCDESRGWGEDYIGNPVPHNDFNKELVTSHNSIVSNANFTPKYYIFPYDRFTNAANDKLKELNYIGSRTGFTSQANSAFPIQNPPFYRNGYNQHDEANFTPDEDGFFRTAVVVDVPNTTRIAINLDYWAQYAINNGVWVNREMHNVGPSGWGRIDISDYRSHLDFVASKVATNELWVGTISEILTYQMQKLKYIPSGNYNSSNEEIVVSWNTPSFDVAGYLAPLSVKSPITLKVDISDLPAINDLNITQAGNTITDFTIDNNTLLVDVYPHEGSVVISNSNTCPTICISEQPSNKVVNEGGSTTLTVTANSGQSINYTWYKDNSIISSAPNTASYTISNASINDEGNYYVRLSNSLGTINSTTISVDVEGQTPYLGSPISIPGKLEFEYFDLGGQGVAYNETVGFNQESNKFTRSDNAPVDLGIFSNTTYVGWTTTGEWLEYTVDVAASQTYTFTFNTSGGFTNNEILEIYLDGQKVSSGLTIEPSGSWIIFEESSFAGIYLESGVHVLRFLFTKGEIDFDHADIQPDIINSTTDITSSKEARVYPNPFSSAFKVILGENTPAANYDLYNVNGQLIRTGTINNNEEIQLDDSFESGMYFMKIESDLINQNIKIVKK